MKPVQRMMPGMPRARPPAQHKKEAAIGHRRAASLAALAAPGSVSRAARLAGVPRRTAYDWRAADEAFGKAWDEALERGTDVLEDEAVRRASEGTLRPVFQGGKKVGTVREYSDLLLIFMLKARRPDKYRDSNGRGRRGEAAQDPREIARQIKAALDEMEDRTSGAAASRPASLKIGDIVTAPDSQK